MKQMVDNSYESFIKKERGSFEGYLRNKRSCYQKKAVINPDDNLIISVLDYDHLHNYVSQSPAQSRPPVVSSFAVQSRPAKRQSVFRGRAWREEREEDSVITTLIGSNTAQAIRNRD